MSYCLRRGLATKHTHTRWSTSSRCLWVPEPAATAIATAAFTGARRGEIRGMLWENYEGDQMRITQSVFDSQADEPKSAKSKAPVPVIAPLAKYLALWRARDFARGAMTGTGALLFALLGSSAWLSNTDSEAAQLRPTATAHEPDSPGERKDRGFHPGTRALGARRRRRTRRIR